MTPTQKRFWSVFLCGLLAAALYGAMQPLFHTRWMEFYIERLGDLGGAPLVAIFVVAGIIIAGIAGRGRIAGFLGLHHLAQFPPLWVAVAVGMLTLLLNDALFQNLSASKEACAIVVWWILDDLCDDRYKAMAFILPILFLAVSAVYLSERELGTFRPKGASCKAQEDAEKPVDLNELAEDVDKLIEWFENDDPITDPKQDAFGHGRVAKRIADRLAQLADGTIDASQISTALIGPIGSGKSSIMRMVQEDLHCRPKTKGKVVIVDISMWPYTSAEAAVQGVIDQITHELGKHINILGLRNTSRHYLRAIQTTGGWLGALGHLLDGDDTPAKVLQRLSDAAGAIELKIVIWMEDQERFIATGGNDGKDKARAIRKGVAKLAPMHALLYEIDRCKNIGVVWADIGMDLRFDQHKITRNQEYVPQPEPEETWKLIWCLRESLLPGERFRYIDGADEDVRDSFKRPKEGVHEIVWSNKVERGDQPMWPERAVGEILQTPRELKAALRRFHSKWKVLWGEVDLDDLFVMSIFQSVKPSLVDLCNLHYEALSDGLLANPRASGPDVRSKIKHRADDALNNLLGTEDDLNPNPYRHLLKFVFPFHEEHWRIKQRRKPQGLARGIDYWRAFVQLESPARVIKDQSVMCAVKEYVQGSEAALLDLMQDPINSGRIGAFARPLPQECLPALLEKAMSRVAQSPVPLSRNKRESPLWSFLDVIRDNVGDEEALVQSVQSVIEDLLPTNLHLALRTEGVFGGGGEHPVLNGQDRRKVCEFFFRRAIETIGEDSPSTLIETLRKEEELLLAWVLNSAGGTQAVTQVLDKDMWARFMKVLLGAIREAPEIMLPRVAFLMTRGDIQHPSEITQIDWQAFEIWFGASADEVADLIRQTSIVSGLSEQTQSVYNDVRRHLSAITDDIATQSESPGTGG